MDFINDAVVTVDAFIGAYKHAAVFFSCPVDIRYTITCREFSYSLYSGVLMQILHVGLITEKIILVKLNVLITFC